MKKKVLKSVLPILCVAFTVAGFAACKDGEEHVHTYSTEWSKDAEGHWYDVTCDCADAPENPKIPHVDKNNDSLCDICEYDYGHTHTYETDTWTVNCEQHWRAATCGHVVVGIEQGDHVDTDKDGKCDTCQYVIEDIHVHVFDDEWTSDEEYHWYAALCEHKDEIDGKEAHNLNAAGDCTVCGAHINDVDMTSIEKVLAAAQANNYKISFGDVIATDAVYGGTGAQTLENGKTNRVHFALGNGESYIQYITFDMKGNYVGQDEQWFQDLGNGEVFGAAMLYGEYELSPIDGNANFLNGYNYIPGSILPSDANDTSTLANLFVGLYNQMKEGVRVSNATESVEDGKYAFSYTYYSVRVDTNSTTDGSGDADAGISDNVTGKTVYNVEVEYYNVTVEFTVNDDMIIDKADFQVEVYRDYEADDDIDYAYTDNGDGTITFTEPVTLKPTANPSFYTYSVAQTSGKRTFTTPYPKEALIPTGFEFEYVLETDWNDDYTEQVVTKSEKIGDSLEIVAGEYAKFAIGDVLPKTASTKFLNTEDFTYTFVNNDPNSTAQAWNPNDETLNGYNAFSQLLKLKILDIGEYTVTVACGDITKTFTLTVVPPKATSISAQVFAWEEDYYNNTYYEASRATAITVKEGETFDFTAVVSPDAASQEFTYSLNKTTGATITEVTLENVTVNYESFETYTAYQFKADVAGTYAITVKDKDNRVSATLTVTVLKEGTLDLPYEITAAGDYTCEFPGGDDCVWYTYTPNEGGYLTVSTAFGVNGWLMVGMDKDSLVSNDGSGEPVKTYVKANTTCYIGVGDYSNAESTVPFTVAFEAGEPIPDGTADLPYALKENNSCEFPGGFGYVFYSYTAETAGTLTITMTSDDYSWGYGSGQWEMTNVFDATGDIVLAANETVLIGVGSSTYMGATITFTSSFVEGTAGGDVEPSETALVMGNNNINAQNVTYAYTATEAGTLNLAAGGATMGMVSISYTVNGGESKVLELSTNVDLALVAGDKVVITVEAEGYSTLIATWTAEAPTTPALVMGHNAINAKDAVYEYVAAEDGTLNLKLTAAVNGAVSVTYTVNGGESTALALSSNVDLTLVAGDKVVVTVVAAGYATLDAAWTVAPNGTEDHPYVVEALPTDIKVTANCNDMIWYTFTVTETGTFTATFDTDDSWFRVVNAEGTVMISGYKEGPYTGTLTAGTYTMGIATWDAESLEVTVNVKFEVASTGGDSEEGGVKTYVSAKHTNGRLIQITIDAKAGTISVIKSTLSGVLDTNYGATEKTGTYSYDGSTVVATVSGYTFTWKADGTPDTVTDTATYTGFTLQA